MRTSAAYSSTSQTRRHNKAVIALQAQAFASWKDLIVYRQVKRSAMSDSIRRLLHGTLGRSFAAWSNTVHERAALKQKAATCLARLAHAHVASAFTAWLEWAAEQKDHRCAAACGKHAHMLQHGMRNCSHPLPVQELDSSSISQVYS